MFLVMGERTVLTIASSFTPKPLARLVLPCHHCLAPWVVILLLLCPDLRCYCPYPSLTLVLSFASLVLSFASLVPFTPWISPKTVAHSSLPSAVRRLQADAIPYPMFRGSSELLAPWDAGCPETA